MKLITALLLSLSVAPLAHSEEKQQLDPKPTLNTVSQATAVTTPEVTVTATTETAKNKTSKAVEKATPEAEEIKTPEATVTAAPMAVVTDTVETTVNTDAKTTTKSTVVSESDKAKSNIIIKVEKSAETSKTNPVSSKKLIKLAPLPDNIEGKPARFGFIRKLLDTSSGARQVKQSKSSEAQMHFRLARQHYADAATTSDTKEVNQLLDKTVREMYKAIRLASPKELTNRKKKHDFDRRLKSVEALQTAFNRVANEKKKSDEADQLNSSVADITSQAKGFYKDNKFDLAREQLDSAYLLIKSSISNLRSGDTLVRELSFASKEEEYHYEIDRNDTHQMLLNLLVAKKLSTRPESFKKRINERVELAKVIRKEAEAYAVNGDYDEAVKALERSTKQLVRAIRMGGVFIPG